MKIKRNFFDIPAMKPENSLRILFLTDLLSDEIKSGVSVFRKLSELSTFEEIEVYFSQTNDDELKRIVNDKYGCICCEYTFDSEFVGIVCKNDKREIWSIVEYNHNINNACELFDKVDGEYINRMEDWIIKGHVRECSPLDLFDFVAVTSHILEALPTYKKHFTVSIDNLMEKIRLFMLNYRLFYVKKCYKVDEASYYAYRRMKYFPPIRHLWRLLPAENEDSEWIQSLYTRLDLYLRAVDKIKINTLRNPANSVGVQLKYDFAFLVFIITGMFDNLAWLICKIYDIDLDKRKIMLVMSPKEREREFAKEVSKKCLTLYNYLTCDLVQAKMDLIYPVRDSIVHREYLQTVHYSDVQKKFDTILLKVSVEMIQKLNRLNGLGVKTEGCFMFREYSKTTMKDIATGKTTIQGESRELLILPCNFVNFIDSIVVDVINGFLDIITASVRDDIANNATSESGFFNFNGSDIEPVFF